MYFLYISHAILDVKVLSIEKADYTNVLLKSQELKSKRDIVMNDYNNISENDIAVLNKIIPNKFDPIAVVSSINNIATKYGISLKSFKVDEPKVNGQDTMMVQTVVLPYKTSTLNITVSGGYNQFLFFLKDIESSLKLMDVNSLSIKSSGNEKLADNSLEYTLQISTYSLK